MSRDVILQALAGLKVPNPEALGIDGFHVSYRDESGLEIHLGYNRPSLRETVCGGTGQVATAAPTPAAHTTAAPTPAAHTTAAPAPAAHTTAAPALADKAPPPPPATSVGIAELNAALRAKAAELGDGGAAIFALLREQFGVDAITNIDPARYEELLGMVSALGAPQ